MRCGIFNNSLLTDLEFRDIFKFFLGYFRNRKFDFQSLQQWWDFGKIQIKQLSQQYACNITKDLTNLMANLEEDIKRLHESIYTERNQELFGILDEKKKELAKILNLKAQGVLIRSRFQNIEWMDIPSKKILTCEKKNCQKRCIYGLRSKGGTLLLNHIEIRKRAVEFYEELYSSELTHRSDSDMCLLKVFLRYRMMPMASFVER